MEHDEEQTDLTRENLLNPDYADMARALLDAGAEFMCGRLGTHCRKERAVNRTVVKKTSLHGGEDALCHDLSVPERLAVLAELNRVGLAAIGVADAPLLRTAVRKSTLKSFSSRQASLVAAP